MRGESPGVSKEPPTSLSGDVLSVEESGRGSGANETHLALGAVLVSTFAAWIGPAWLFSLKDDAVLKGGGMPSTHGSLVCQSLSTAGTV